MTRVEDQGFLAMVSFDAKLTVAEGVVIGAGAIAAAGLLYLSSRSLAEFGRRATPEEIAELKSVLAASSTLEKRISDRFVERRIEPQVNRSMILQHGVEKATELWWKQHLDETLEVIAKNAIASNLTPEEIEHLASTRFIDFLVAPTYQFQSRHGKGQILKRLANLPPELLSWGAEFMLKGETRQRVLLDYKLEDPLIESFAMTDIEVMKEAIPIADLIQTTNTHAFESAKSLVNRGFKFEDLDGIDHDFVYMMGNAQRQGRISNEDLKAAVQKLRRYSGEDLATVSRWIRTDHDVIEFAKLDLDVIPPQRFGVNPMTDEWDAPDWDLYAKRVERFKSLPFDLLSKANVPESNMIHVWSNALGHPKILASIYTLAAVGESTDAEFVADICYQLATSLGSAEDDTDIKIISERVKTLGELLKKGAIKKLVDETTPLKKSDWFLKDVLQMYISHAENVKPWKDFANLYEQLLKLDKGGSSVRKDRYSEEDKILHRTRDRLAQRDPEWAISEYSVEYNRGKRIARFLEQITDRIEEMVRQGETVVIHGRDGELLYDLLMRRPGIDRSKVKYAITSRPVTTWSASMPVDEPHARELRRYWDYLQRLVPLGAVHIDTGFEGSIPRWLDKQGFEVKAIKMVSANKPEEQISVATQISDEERRKIVLSDLEHSSQRLELLNKYDPESQTGGFGDLIYSLAAPGYHARKYGVYDELGLPRLRAKTPKTRFEETRLRIAEPEAIVDENEEDLALQAEK